MEDNLPSGTVTFLFTDLEGSTKLWEQYPGEMKLALARHDEIVRSAIESHGGNVIKNTGDGFHAVFDTALNAVEAALAAQQACSNAAWEEIKPHHLHVRIGLHTGEAQERGGDYYGPTLNRAARLMALAHGGQTLLSTTTAGLVRDQLPEDATLRDLGEHRLRDLVRSEHIFQLSQPGIHSEFPALKSIDAFPNNLPVQLTSFIGREHELEDARSRLQSAHLLTLIGPGGTGKTRLAVQLAADLLPFFQDGVWLAEFAPVTDPALVVQSVASVLHLREQMGMPLSDLVTDYLRDKNLLLVLDNCEHLVEACAQLADQLLHACANLKIIASSREALGIAGETVYRVPPLSLPDPRHVTREALTQCESAQLFIERASAANPKFRVDERNADAVAQICRRLDGIPLALELAAARITVFSAEQIAAHLDDRFRLLTGGSRTALPRQQTLRALIDWSYELLSEEERTLLRKLSVFAGGWTFEAAEAVCSELDVLDGLSQLVNKSLVSMEDEEGVPRYGLLETMRQYARDKLLEAGETEPTRNAHFDFFMQLVNRTAPKLRKAGAAQWVMRLDLDYDNIRAALQWGLKSRLEDVLLAIPQFSYFWNRRGYEEEGRQLIREAVNRANELAEFEGEAGRQRLNLLGEAWQTLAMLAYSQGDNARAIEASDQAASIARRLDNKRLLAVALGFKASGALFIGDFEDIQSVLDEGMAAAQESGDQFALGLPLAMYTQALVATSGDLESVAANMETSRKLLKESGDEWGSTMALLSGAMIAKFQGNYAESRKQFLAIEPLFRDLGDQHRINMVRSELAHLERYEGHYQEAEAMYMETIKEWQRIGHRAAVAHQLECLAAIAKINEDGPRAARLFGAAEALRDRINIPMTAQERREYDRNIEDLRSGMDEEVFASNWAEGRAMSMDQAIRFALEKSAVASG